jgi:hypothetical protein
MLDHPCIGKVQDSYQQPQSIQTYPCRNICITHLIHQSYVNWVLTWICMCQICIKSMSKHVMILCQKCIKIYLVKKKHGFTHYVKTMSNLCIAMSKLYQNGLSFVFNKLTYVKTVSKFDLVFFLNKFTCPNYITFDIILDVKTISNLTYW